MHIMQWDSTIFKSHWRSWSWSNKYLQCNFVAYSYLKQVGDRNTSDHCIGRYNNQQITHCKVQMIGPHCTATLAHMRLILSIALSTTPQKVWDAILILIKYLMNYTIYCNESNCCEILATSEMTNFVWEPCTRNVFRV